MIDVVAKTPALLDPARLMNTANSADLRLSPTLVQGLNLKRKADDGQGKSPLSLQAGSLDPQSQTFADSALNRRVDGLHPTGANDPLAYQHDKRLDDAEQQGGFLALRWKASASSEITLGGGYSRSYAQTGPGAQGSASAVRGGSALSATRSDSGLAGGEANGRWGAFLAVPYKLGNSMGVHPEVSYYRDDSSEAGRDSTNEWVMGVRFSFGF